MKIHCNYKLRFLFLSFLPLFASTQNVGIGTASPAMKLHISSPSDTALLQIDNNTTLGVNTNAGIYFKTGSYFTGAVKTIGNGSVVARLGLFTFAHSSQNGLIERLSITDEGNVGIGTTSPVAKLEINGDIKITGGGPGTGKVLTSDGVGLANWQLPAGTNSGFKAVVGSGGFNVATSTNTTIIFTSEEYDDPSAFFSTAFSVPATGLYHFDALINWDIIGVVSASQYVLVVSVDGADRYGNVMQVPASSTGYRTQAISFDIKLTTGQSVSLYVSQNSGMIQTILGTSGSVRYSYFSGRRVY